MSAGPRKPPQKVTLEVATLFREQIARRRISQADVARQADLSTSQMSRFLKGERSPNLDEFMDICDALGAHPEVLLAKAINNVRWRERYADGDPFAVPDDRPIRFTGSTPEN